MKLTQLIKENEERPLSLEVKKHFLEIVSTYNKYQESMDRKSDIIKVAETLGGITEAARTLAIKEGDDWFDKHTVKRNMSELEKLGSQFDKVALEARALDQRMAGLYEDMGHILSRYYKIGEITEDQMKQRLGIRESKDCGCGCGGTTPGGCGDKSVNEETINEATDIYLNKRIQITKFAGQNGQMVQISAPKYQTAGDHIAMSKDEFIRMLKNSSKILNQLKESNESVNKEVVNEASMGEYVLAGLLGAASFAVPAAVIGRGVAAVLKYLVQKEPQLVKKGKMALANESISEETLNEQPVMVSKRTEGGNIVTTLKEVTDLNEEEMKLYEFGQKVEKLMEKSCPTDKGKWAASKAAAKSKFDVYPSAYANGWAAKNYKSKGGGWRDC